jgi:hypothetical protein
METNNYIDANELVFNTDSEAGIYSGGFSVKSIMMKTGMSPIMTVNTNQTGGSNNVSDLFNDLVIPNWAITYNNQMGGGNYKDTSDDNNSDTDDDIDDDLHDKLLELVKEHDKKLDNENKTKLDNENKTKLDNRKKTRKQTKSKKSGTKRKKEKIVNYK